MPVQSDAGETTSLPNLQTDEKTMRSFAQMWNVRLTAVNILECLKANNNTL